MKASGLFISIEGIDGVGKTKAAKSLVRKLLTEGFSALYTCEPTDEGPYGKLVRELLFRKESWKWERALLFVLDRAWHVNNVILPSINEGRIVVCDRYMHSQLAYQIAEGLDRGILEALNLEFPKPDLVIYLDSDPSNAIRRMRHLGLRSRRSVYEDEQFLRRVRQLYLEYLRDPRFTFRYLILNVDELISPETLPSDVFERKLENMVKRMLNAVMKLLRERTYR